MNTATGRQDSNGGTQASKHFRGSRGGKTVVKQSAYSLLIAALLLAVTAVAENPGTPGTDQSGGFQNYQSLQEGTGFDTDASTGNSDPEGRYNWANSYGLRNRVVSYSSTTNGNSTAGATRPEFQPLEGATAGPYLSVATTKFETEVGPANGSGDYSWQNAYESSTKVPYASSKIATNGLSPAIVSAGVLATVPADAGSVVGLPNPAESVEPADAVVFGLLNQ